MSCIAFNTRTFGNRNGTRPPQMQWFYLLVIPCCFTPRWSVWPTRTASPSSKTAWRIVRCRLLSLLSIRRTTSMSTRSHRPLSKRLPSAPGLVWKRSPVSRSTWPHNPTSKAGLCASCCPPISTTRRTSSRRTRSINTTASLWVTKHYLAFLYVWVSRKLETYRNNKFGFRLPVFVTRFVVLFAS